MRRRAVIATVISGAMAALTLPALGVGAASGAASGAVSWAAGTGDRQPAPTVGVRHTGPDYNNGKALPLRRDAARQLAAAERSVRAPAEVGDKRIWPALDDAQGAIYVKNYRLRGVGENVAVWTAADRDKVSGLLRFQPGDCRNGERTRITNEQVQYLIDEFDQNMYPKESEVFSVPPSRDGSAALLAEILGLPATYYRGQGDKIVVLVDNVRDANFYDLDNTENTTYIAGFFSSLFNEFANRNVMTIDGFDWLHRTGATPPDEPVPGDNCASAPARPFLYEGVFAHEYQHLLEYYEDPDEAFWVNEGLSDWAQTLTGYVDPSVPINDIDYNSHIQCFLGYLGVQTPANPNPRDGGPENSLSLWEDQGEDETLCDYGATYTMMEYLRDRYGEDFMTRLHRGDANSLVSLGNNLDIENAGATPIDLVHRWAAMVALDSVVDGGAVLTGGPQARYSTDTLDARIRWATKEAYSRLGAPPNGSDYVRLRPEDRPPYLSAGEVDEIAFDGASTLPPIPLRWRVDRTPPNHRTPTLYSGSGPDLDRAIVQRVRVPAGDPTLRFDTKWRIENHWDFGFVQVSTDGGRTYQSLGNKDTTRRTNPEAIAAVKENVPGFTGNSNGWRPERFDLSEYAGERILLSFRYVTDPEVDLPGWWVDNVAVGRNTISVGKALGPWSSQTQIVPTPVSGFTVQLVAYDDAGTEAWVGEVELDADFDGSLSGAEVAAEVGATAETVAAIVTYDEPTDSITQYAPYRLRVNGVLQPGG